MLYLFGIPAIAELLYLEFGSSLPARAVLHRMASPTATVTAGTLATVSVAQIGLLVVYTHIFGSLEATATPAPGTVTAPACPECPHRPAQLLGLLIG